MKQFFLLEEYHPEQNVDKITENLRTEISVVESQMQPLIDLISSKRNTSFTELNQQVGYPFYLYEKSRLAYWSDYRFTPDYENIAGEYNLKYVSNEHGKFVVRKWETEVEGIKKEVFSFIPLFKETSIVNEYLDPSYNESIFDFPDLIVSGQPQENLNVEIDGKFLFSIDSQVEYSVINEDAQFVSIALLSIGILIALFLITTKVNYLTGKKYIGRAFILMAFSLIALRIIMLTGEFPNSFANWTLFDSKLFASSNINPSIGDLLLNTLVIFVLVFYVFRNYHRSYFFIKTLEMSNYVKLLLSIVLAGIGFFVLLYHYFIFKTIYNNSQWSLDITNNLDFNISKVVFYFIFVLNSAIVFFAYHIIFRIIIKLTDRSIYNLVLSFSLGALLFIYLTYILQIPAVFVVILNIVFFFILHFLKLPRFLIQMRYLAFLYLFLSALSSALVGAYSIYNFEENNKHMNKIRFADQFLVENDNLAELLLSEAVQKIEEDPLITSRIYSPFMPKEAVAQKIRRVYLGNSYFDKYNIQIYLYNAKGEPFEEESTTGNYYQIKDAFASEQYETDFENLYFVNRIGADIAKRYLYFVDVVRYDNVIGHIILDLSLKKIIPKAVYPELLVDSRFFLPYQNTEYSYAVFKDDQITYNSGDFNYFKNFNYDLLSNANLFQEGIHYNGYQHLGVVDKDNRIIVISSPVYPLINLVSNFSFLFLILVVLIILMVGIYSTYISFRQVNLKYATKIQLYLNLAFVLPLFVVSITTLSIINRSFKKELENEYQNKAEVVSRNIINDLKRYNQLIIDHEQLSNNLSQVATNANLDVNLFNIRGRLVATSQPSIYENNLLSEYINPVVMESIKEQGNNKMILKESVGSLKYNSSYMGVKSFDTGELIGILSIPFFDSEYILERQQIDVLSNIMNIFSAIFLVFLLISYLASKRLTLPLNLITKGLQHTTLAGKNQPLVWNSNDEIGMLIGEYNKMLLNLERSKNALAKSEKEMAWREMAQQVAHEIKNPLTPMKLTLQHLERSLKEDLNADFKKAEKPINTLLYQIQSLNEIASSFSSFAKMPIPEINKFEITSLLKKTFGLYDKIKNGKVEFKNPNRNIYVLGDEQLMGRIISNVIINSIQSVPADRKVNIEGSISANSSEKVRIKIKDNGKGIPEEIQDKIFLPNFSTKKDGTGIGLAIAKHGIEHAGGKIWFESEDNSGTTFYIELPQVI